MMHQKFWYSLTHAQTVCTRPSKFQSGPGNEASVGKSSIACVNEIDVYVRKGVVTTSDFIILSSLNGGITIVMHMQIKIRPKF